MSELPLIRVVAAVIPSEGRFLLTKRGPGRHMSGYWEFPGGKIEDGESHADALARELEEELGIETVVGDQLWEILHEYPERRVVLHFLAAEIVAGPLRALDVEDFGWFRPAEMAALPILPADLPLVPRLEALADE